VLIHGTAPEEPSIVRRSNRLAAPPDKALCVPPSHLQCTPQLAVFRGWREQANCKNSYARIFAPLKLLPPIPLWTMLEKESAAA
jgi:hypothetical protein